MKIHYPLTPAYVHWLDDPDGSGQAVHSGSFASVLAALICNSLYRFTTANAPANETYRETVTQMPIASVVRGKAKKKKNKPLNVRE